MKAATPIVTTKPPFVVRVALSQDTAPIATSAANKKINYVYLEKLWSG